MIASDNHSTYLDDAREVLAALGPRADYLVPLGALGPFAQWLGFPDWMRDGTSLKGSGPLPQTASLRDDTIIIANMLDHGHGPFLLGQILSTDRLITGPNVSLIVRNAPTLGDAMRNLAIALSATNPNISATFQVRRSEANFDVLGRVPSCRLLDFIAAVRMILALRVVERFLLRRTGEAWLKLTMPEHICGENAFSVIAGRIDFSSDVNRLSFPAAWVERRNPDFDPILWKVARQRVFAMQRRATHSDLVGWLRQRVSAVVAQDKRVPRLKEMAAELGMNDRTLSRKLSALGIRFQSIVDEERKSLVRQYLSDRSIPVAMIANLAGFTNPSSFSRSFRAWFGTSPSTYRFGYSNNLLGQ